MITNVFKNGASSSVKYVTAFPSRPARPVRPSTGINDQEHDKNWSINNAHLYGVHNFAHSSGNRN